jgi:hypothetical protein
MARADQPPPEWFRPIRHAVVLASQGRGRDENMRAAVIHGLMIAPPGSWVVLPASLIMRIAPPASRPTIEQRRADGAWLATELASTKRRYVIDTEELVGALVVKAG